MVVPEFILRKLFVKGSLKKEGAGFSFAINNTFAPATLSSVGLDVDGSGVDKNILFMGPEGGELRKADEVSPERPLPLSVGVVYTVKALTLSGQRKTHDKNRYEGSRGDKLYSSGNRRGSCRFG